MTGDDSAGNEWTITTVGTTSFTANANYYQVGSSNKPATSITFTTTLPNEVTITDFSAKFGGFNSTAGTISLKVDDDEVKSGSLSGTSDVTVSTTSSVTGTELKITITGIAKGVKAYYISYTYESAGSGSGSTDSDLALTDAPITLNFDLYNNNSAQEIAYTTSSTGTVSVVKNDYVDATVNQETKKISITPKKVTGSAQTITVNQAADETYAAGSATFTVNITDSTPKETFEKITSAGDLATGDELIIVAENYNVAAGTRGSNTYLAPVDVTIDNNQIEVPAVGSDVNVFVICDDIDGTWTLYSKKDSEYIYESAVKTLDSGNNGSWSISFDNDGNAVVSGLYPLRYNASSPRFTTYNGSGQDIQLYRKVIDRTHVTVGPTGYTTYVTKKNVSFPEEVTAYIATEVDGGYVTLEEVASAPVNTALVIKADADEYELTEVAKEDCADVSGNRLDSSNGYIEGNETNIYALGMKPGTVGFYLVGNGEKIPVGKAYLEYTSSSVKDFMSFNFGQVDAIESVKANGQWAKNNAVIYNLNGQRMSVMQKGINIVNGKKYVVK